jgi:hypothetical protein
MIKLEDDVMKHRQSFSLIMSELKGKIELEDDVIKLKDER